MGAAMLPEALFLDLRIPGALPALSGAGACPVYQSFGPGPSQYAPQEGLVSAPRLLRAWSPAGSCAYDDYTDSGPAALLSSEASVTLLPGPLSRRATVLAS